MKPPPTRQVYSLCILRVLKRKKKIFFLRHKRKEKKKKKLGVGRLKPVSKKLLGNGELNPGPPRAVLDRT